MVSQAASSVLASDSQEAEDLLHWCVRCEVIYGIPYILWPTIMKSFVVAFALAEKI